MERSFLRIPVVVLMLSAGASAATVTVDVLDSSFSPESLLVMPGDTVVWTNNGVFPHTTTSGVDGNPDGIWDSGTLSNGQSFSHVFPDEGEFPYYCTFHYRGGMVGTVIVSATEVEEGQKTVRPSMAATIVYGSVFRAGPSPALLIDATGRPVARLEAGENNLSTIPPGAYFLYRADPSAGITRLVVIR
jgi:plastocyanin